MAKFKILVFLGVIFGMIMAIIGTCADIAMKSKTTESGIATLFCGIIVLIFLAVSVVNYSSHILNDRGK